MCCIDRLNPPSKVPICRQRKQPLPRLPTGRLNCRSARPPRRASPEVQRSAVRGAGQSQVSAPAVVGQRMPTVCTPSELVRLSFDLACRPMPSVSCAASSIFVLPRMIASRAVSPRVQQPIMSAQACMRARRGPARRAWLCSAQIVDGDRQKLLLVCLSILIDSVHCRGDRPVQRGRAQRLG